MFHAIISRAVTKTNLKTVYHRPNLIIVECTSSPAVHTKLRHGVTAASLNRNHSNYKLPRAVIDIISRQFPKALFIFNQILSRRLNNIFLPNMKIMEINSA